MTVHAFVLDPVDALPAAQYEHVTQRVEALARGLREVLGTPGVRVFVG